MDADQIPLHRLRSRPASGWALPATLAGVVPLGVVLLVGFALRVPDFFSPAVSADEALFSTWARQIAVWRDPLLQSQAVDKPPLLFYTQAIFYPLLGPVAWAARLPNWIASLALIALVARWARRLGSSRDAMLLAAGIVAFAPLAIRFSTSAIIDPLMTALLVGALLQVSGPTSVRSASWGGVLFGLALLTKYQAWLFLPLIAALAWCNGWTRREGVRFLAGVAPALLVLLLWDGPQLVARQWASYGGIRPIVAWELLPRLQMWVEVGGPLFVACLVGGPVALILAWRRRGAPVDIALLLFAYAYALLHWLLAIPGWARYLLPVLPIVALLGGRGAAWTFAQVASDRIRPILVWASLGALLLLVLPPALSREVSADTTPADSAVAAAAHHLTDAPYGTVLYDHWFSWQWRYHLFDSGVYVDWTPHPQQLITDLDAFYDDRRFIALPQSAEALPFRRALNAAGYTLRPVTRDGAGSAAVLYKIGRK